MSTCPGCKKRIAALKYTKRMNVEETGLFSTKDGFSQTNQELLGLDTEEYTCPECEALIAGSEDEAYKFLDPEHTGKEKAKDKQ